MYSTYILPNYIRHIVAQLALQLIFMMTFTHLMMICMIQDMHRSENRAYTVLLLCYKY